MITDLPTGDDFNTSGIDFLNLAWTTLVGLLSEIKDTRDYYYEHYVGEGEEAKPLQIDKYWEKSQPLLSTTLSLIQQGTEFLLKGHIATVSPYLLISGDPISYPSKSRKHNMRFSEFKTIDAQDLIKVYNMVSVEPLPDSFQQRFENLRSKRNTIMHTIARDSLINIEELLVEILEICHQLIAPESWIDIRANFIQNQPAFVLIEDEYSQYDKTIYELTSEINLVIDLLQPSEVRKYFKFEKKQRRYICPSCYRKAFRETYAHYGGDMPKLAQLSPNEPISNSVFCIVCHESSTVIREDCSVEGCLGNVISNSLCMTCGEYS